MRLFTLAYCVCASVLAVRLPAAEPAGPTFALSLAPELSPAQGQPKPAGRLYLVLASPAQARPLTALGDWFDPPQVLSIDVDSLDAAVPLTITAQTPGLTGFPNPLNLIPAGEYRLQALLRTNLDACSPSSGEGNLSSKPMAITLPVEAGAGPVSLTLSGTVKPRPFRENDRIRYFEMVSPSLTAFHGREVKIRAGVKLPIGWKDDPDAHSPTVYFVTGFGGDHQTVRSIDTSDPWGDKNILWVVPDPTCFTGHSVFADSACNGPRGRALMDELIPELEKKFHGAGEGVDGAGRRYVTGISSGGWSSLWLQITYPEKFAGCWSHCPDPVDFHDFQRIDLYAPDANLYNDEKGAGRPLARQGDRVMIWYRDFVAMENALGPGGQIGSFEAVFSPTAGARLKGGYLAPKPLFDRSTGNVDPAVAKAWERYDIRLVLERNWNELGPKLTGKLHVYAGEDDNFYLEGAVRRLGESLKALGSDAQVTIVPGMSHTICSDGWRDMVKAIQNAHAAQAIPAGTP